jgi:hypothetical protein
LDVAALDRLIGASKKVCETPADYGYSAQGGVSADIKAGLSKLVKFLAGADVGASLKAKGEYHKGVPAKDYASALGASNACAANVFNHLVDTFYLSDLRTGAVIRPPPDPRAYFGAHSSAQLNISDSNIQSGKNNIQIVMRDGTVTLLPPPTRAIDNRALITGIASIVSAGMQIQQAYIAENDVAEITKQHDQWLHGAYNYLSSQLDNSYAVEFEQATFSGDTPVDHSINGNAYWGDIQAKNDVLVRMLDDLRAEQRRQ